MTTYGPATKPKDPTTTSENKHIIRRITIIDKFSACPLYDKIYSWKADDQSPATAAKLLSLYNSIATTFKDGEDKPRRVVFEQTSENVRKAKTYGKYSTGLPSLGGRANASKNTTSSASRFMMAQNPNSPSASELELFIQTVYPVCVAIFIKPGSYIGDSWDPVLLKDLGDQFYREYRTLLDQLRPTFQDMAKDSELARNTLTYMSNFSNFSPQLTSDYITEDTSQSANGEFRKKTEGASFLPLSNDIIAGGDSANVGYSTGAEPILSPSHSAQPKFLPEMATTPRSEHSLPTKTVAHNNSTSSTKTAAIAENQPEPPQHVKTIVSSHSQNQKRIQMTTLTSDDIGNLSDFDDTDDC